VPLERHAPTLPGRAVIEQRWNRAVFVHWRVDPDEVAPLLPAGTRPDVHDGAAWVGLVPFVLSEFRFLPLPPVPFVGTFTEINVRTYAVDDAGRRGVVFRTLEAEHLAQQRTALDQGLQPGGRQHRPEELGLGRRRRVQGGRGRGGRRDLGTGHGPDRRGGGEQRGPTG